MCHNQTDIEIHSCTSTNHIKWSCLGIVPWLRRHRHLTENWDLRLCVQSPAAHAGNYSNPNCKKRWTKPFVRVKIICSDHRLLWRDSLFRYWSCINIEWVYTAQDYYYFYCWGSEWRREKKVFDIVHFEIVKILDLPTTSSQIIKIQFQPCLLFFLLLGGTVKVILLFKPGALCLKIKVYCLPHLFYLTHQYF